MNQLKIRLPYALLLVRQLFLQPGQLAVAELRQRGVIISSLCGLDLLVTLKNLLTQLREPFQGSLLILPLRLPAVKFRLKICQLLLKGGQSFLTQSIGLLFQRFLVRFQAENPAIQLIQLGRHGVFLGLNLGAGLIHQVDGLVRQKPVCYITV